MMAIGKAPQKQTILIYQLATDRFILSIFVRSPDVERLDEIMKIGL